MEKGYMRLTIFHFECFFMVVESGTMLEAAQKLYISQPLLSQKIAQLEDLISTKLFLRQKKRLILTEAGKYFYENSKRIIEDFDNVITMLDERYRLKGENRLKIGFSNGQEPSEIYTLIELMRGEFPETDFQVEINSRLVITEKLINGDIDIVFMIDTEKIYSMKNIRYRKVTNFTMNCIVRSNTEIAKRPQIDIADLNDFTCFWPSSFKNTAHTKDLQKLFSEKNVNLNWEYHDVDFFTLRRYLYGEKQMTLTFSPEMDDSNYKLLALSGISYPLIIAWNSQNEINDRYVNKLLTITKSIL